MTPRMFINENNFNLHSNYNYINEEIIETDNESVESNDSFSSVDTTYDILHVQHLYLFKVTPFVYTLYSLLVYMFLYYVGSIFY
tara:strand:+ start:701 stop:952 length:252 start_codon:yes stop_codon:yes gene_type:complete